MRGGTRTPKAPEARQGRAARHVAASSAASWPVEEMLRLQGAIGNRAVDRLLQAKPEAGQPHGSAGGGLARGLLAGPAPLLARLPEVSDPGLQRYPVPGKLACAEVAGWLDQNSPYSPEWARTRWKWAFVGNYRIESAKLPEGGVQLTAKGHKGLKVTFTSKVDLPQWSPSQRPNRRAEVGAWNNMRSVLDAHEQEHRKIGQEWRAILEQRYQELEIVVTGANQAEAMKQLQQEVAATKEAWLAEAQAAQDAIDPFRGATLECPAEGEGE